MPRDTLQNAAANELRSLTPGVLINSERLVFARKQELADFTLLSIGTMAE